MPARFRKCSTPIEQGGYGVSLAKKPQGSLTEERVRLCATKLRTALDVPSFARSPRWATFRSEADELHSMLLTKAGAIPLAEAAALSSVVPRTDCITCLITFPTGAGLLSLAGV